MSMTFAQLCDLIREAPVSPARTLREWQSAGINARQGTPNQRHGALVAAVLELVEVSPPLSSNYLDGVVEQAIWAARAAPVRR